MGRNEYDVRVTGLEPNRLVEITTLSGPIKPTATYRFETEEAATRFHRRVKIPLSGGRRLLKPLMAALTRRRNAGFVANLKRLLESGAAS